MNSRNVVRCQARKANGYSKRIKQPQRAREALNNAIGNGEFEAELPRSACCSAMRASPRATQLVAAPNEQAPKAAHRAALWPAKEQTGSADNNPFYRTGRLASPVLDLWEPDDGHSRGARPTHRQPCNPQRQRFLLRPSRCTDSTRQKRKHTAKVARPQSACRPR